MDQQWMVAAVVCTVISLLASRFLTSESYRYEDPTLAILGFLFSVLALVGYLLGVWIWNLPP